MLDIYKYVQADYTSAPHIYIMLTTVIHPSMFM